MHGKVSLLQDAIVDCQSEQQHNKSRASNFPEKTPPKSQP
jgi:hypothetical protein